MLIKPFKVDNLKYEFTINQNSISFAVISGCSKRGCVNNYSKYELFRDTHIYADINICMSPFKVLKKVSEYSLEWIRTKKPYMFSFYSSSVKKQKVYNLIVDKVLNKNLDILNNYNYIRSDEGNFQFYKKASKIIST